MDTQVVTALIATGTTLSTLFIKDVLLHRINELREGKKKEREVYRRYSKPLQQSLEKLVGRLIEICEKENLKLKYNQHGSHYYNYKYLSTLYRFFCVLAWLRLAGKEITFYKVSKRSDMKKLNSAIYNFQSALADGMSVHTKRVINALNSTNVSTLTVEKEDIQIIGDKLDMMLLDVCGKRYEIISKEKKDDLINEIVKLMKNQFDRDVTILNDDEFYRNICIKESWIYRDWQDAIGDMMIKNDKLMSYREFEEVYCNESEKVWITRGESLFNELSISNKQEYDFRVIQVKNILNCSYRLLKALQKININGSIVNKKRMKNFERKVKELTLG